MGVSQGITPYYTGSLMSSSTAYLAKNVYLVFSLYGISYF